MIGGGWRPRPAEEDLLEAAVGPETRTLTAWQSWRARLGAGGANAIDAGSSKILPLLMPRLALLPADDSLREVIRGCYRRGLYHGRLLRARAARVLQVMAAAGIPTLVLKGGVLGQTYYGDPGLRPMNDFDVLVPRPRAFEAIRLLAAAGWVSAQPMPESLPDAYHSACFQSPDRLDFDLHWHLVPEACFPGADDPVWPAAEALTVEGVTTTALCATDLLVVVCAHAALWSPVAPARWVADALTILRRRGELISWPRAAELAQRWHVVPHVRETLRYLEERWAAGVPRDWLDELDARPVARTDRRAYEVLGRMPGPLTYLMRPWVRYRLRSRDRGWALALPGFVDYLKITLGHTRARALPGEIIRRYRRWRIDRAGKRR